MNFSSLDDAFPDKPWPKRTPLSSSKHVPEHRDSEKEGRTFPTPVHRGQNAIQKHKKTIDDLTNSLPIQEEDNFNPPRISPLKENFANPKEFPYSPPGFQEPDTKMQKLIEMVDQIQGQETPIVQDMLLYVFTGVFFLYTFELLSK